MIQFNPHKRITAYDALSLPYFQNVPQSYPIYATTESQNIPISQNQTNNLSRSHLMLQKPVLRNTTRNQGRVAARHTINNVYSMQSCAASEINANLHASHGMPNDIGPGANIHLRSCAVGGRGGANGYDEVDSGHIYTTVVDSNLNINQRAHCSLVHSNRPGFDSTQNNPDLEQYQHNLMLSVVNHAINDTSGQRVDENKSESSLSIPFSSSAQKQLQPRRSITRQQTRSMRRHTQHNLTTTHNSNTGVGQFQLTNSAIIVTQTEVCPGAKVLNKLSNSNGRVLSCSPSLAQGENEKSGSVVKNASVTRTGRQRKTARRRTVMGLVDVSFFLFQIVIGMIYIIIFIFNFMIKHRRRRHLLNINLYFYIIY